MSVIFPFALWAQKTMTVKGDYTYYPPETQSLEVARHIAVERAKIQLLADNFGTVISSVTSTKIYNSSKESSTNTTMLSNSDVRGEWIETLEGPFISTTISPEGMIGINVAIKGIIRELVTSQVDIIAKTLRNGTSDKYESMEFRSGDDLYLKFKSPVDGFLAVYLYDGDDTVYCLLPYQNQKSTSIPVSQGKDYTFFSTENNTLPIEESSVDEYVMTCSRQTELNQIHVVFSQDNFCLASDIKKGESFPRYLSYKDFNSWLSRLKNRDNKLMDKVLNITIDK